MRLRKDMFIPKKLRTITITGIIPLVIDILLMIFMDDCTFVLMPIAFICFILCAYPGLTWRSMFEKNYPKSNMSKRSIPHFIENQQLMNCYALDYYKWIAVGFGPLILYVTSRA